jgi:hypothetical protein
MITSLRCWWCLALFLALVSVCDARAPFTTLVSALRGGAGKKATPVVKKHLTKEERYVFSVLVINIRFFVLTILHFT